MNASDPELTPWAVGEIVLTATRGLLTLESAERARELARELITRLGGSTILASEVVFSLPLDISFGVGEPELPWAPQSSAAMMLLEQHLPRFVDDARRAIARASETERFAEDASVDVLTGLPNRRSLARFLGRLHRDDVLIMLDLDRFKQVNDAKGHEAGDRVLRALGRTLLEQVRARDRVGRYGGEEFVIVLSDHANPDQFLSRLRTQWEVARPLDVSFSAGIAPVAPDPEHTLVAADRAMYRAKAAGRDQWLWAEPEDYVER